ncbi:hypothetical protein BaRGS_00029287 [Batillaria attramentaria]|uniref:Uncharacterized protein n=1 Tax=Batillaria attramentaria TaxID=370345 RepID=A0ABD0JXK0_9CAEN
MHRESTSVRICVSVQAVQWDPDLTCLCHCATVLQAVQWDPDLTCLCHCATVLQAVQWDPDLTDVFVSLCVTGSAVRRLRYYSEGEETVGQSSLPHGPLPDLVPVTHVTRERSLSAPDLETLQRQRLAAREVGRELRRISDEFLHTYNARADNRDGAVAALHAELNGVAAFFLTGVRRFMYRGFAGYFRHVFNWTRRAMNSAVYTPDSSVDEQR